MSKDTQNDEKVLALMDAQTDKQIFTWEDLFKQLNKAFEEYTQCRCPAHTLEVVMRLYAFMKIMEEYPEEGDVLVVAKKMNKIMLENSKKMGVIFAASEDEMEQAIVDAVNEAAREVAESSDHFMQITEEDLSGDRKIH